MRDLHVFLATAALVACAGCGAEVSTSPSPSPSPSPAPTPTPSSKPGPWSLVGNRPGPRSNAAALVDAKRDRMLVYGGGGNDLWAMALGGSSTNPWTQLQTGDGPPPGTGAIAIDDAKDALLVFANDSLDHAWTLPLDGSAPWSTVDFATGHTESLYWTVALDTAARNIYAYSGIKQTLLTAPMGGGAWTELPKPDAPYSTGDVLVVDQKLNRLLLLANGEQTPRVFAMPLDGSATWTKLDTVTLTDTSGHACAWDPAHRRFLLAQNAWVWAFSVDDPMPTWNQLAGDSNVFEGRLEAANAFDAARSHWILFGGMGYDWFLHDDSWAFDLSAAPAWTHLDAAVGTYDTYAGQALGYLPDSSKLLRFGGSRVDASPSNEFRLDAGEWISLADKPPVTLTDSAGAWDPNSARFIAFGGGAPPGSNTLLAYDPATVSWTNLQAKGSKPPARLRHAMVGDDAGGRMLLFGGVDSNDMTHFLDDLWEYTPATEAWDQLDVPDPKPAGRARFGAAFDADGERMFVVGGNAKAGALSDAWVLDLAPSPHWTQLSPKGAQFEPKGSIYAAYDGASKKLVVIDIGLIDDGILGGAVEDPVAYTLATGAEPAWTRYCQKGLRPGSIDGAIATRDGVLFTSKGSTWRFDPTVAPCP